MRRANIVSGIILALSGLVMLGLVIPWQIEEGPPGMMSPRLVPGMMMALVVGLSCLLAYNNWRAKAAPEDRFPISWPELASLGKLGGVFAASIVLYFWVAPLAAGLALMVGALLVFGERRLSIIILLPAAFMLSIWLLFYKVLGTAII